MFKWPTRAEVVKALAGWGFRAGRAHPELRGLGYFGSYARGDWGVGSDLDIIVLVGDTVEPFETWARRWNTETLPVPVDILVYTRAEWEKMGADRNRFIRRIEQEIVWLEDGHSVEDRPSR